MLNNNNNNNNLNLYIQETQKGALIECDYISMSCINTSGVWTPPVCVGLGGSPTVRSLQGRDGDDGLTEGAEQGAGTSGLPPDHVRLQSETRLHSGRCSSERVREASHHRLNRVKEGSS